MLVSVFSCFAGVKFSFIRRGLRDMGTPLAVSGADCKWYDERCNVRRCETRGLKVLGRFNKARLGTRGNIHLISALNPDRADIKCMAWEHACSEPSLA